MRRVQLFEFLDQSWLPGWLRTAVTRYLTATYATTPFPVLWAAILARALDRCQSGRVVDLGSGAGGPMELVLGELARLQYWPQVTLTDLYPEPTSAACSTPLDQLLAGARERRTCAPAASGITYTFCDLSPFCATIGSGGSAGRVPATSAHLYL